jgi:mRNA interferase HigB
MKLVGRGILFAFCKKHADVSPQISAWCAEVEEAQWKGPPEIKLRYTSASFLAGNRVVFNLKGNKYRLDTKVNYKHQVILVKRIGTHAEYSKWEF